MHVAASFHERKVQARGWISLRNAEADVEHEVAFERRYHDVASFEPGVALWLEDIRISGAECDGPILRIYYGGPIAKCC